MIIRWNRWACPIAALLLYSQAWCQLPESPHIGKILAHDPDLEANVAPLTLTNNTTVTVHLLGLEGNYDAVLISESPTFTSQTQSFYRPPLGTYDGSTTVTFELSPGDEPKTIYTILAKEGYVTPPTSATLRMDTKKPEMIQRAVENVEGSKLRVKMKFSEPVHDFTPSDVVLGGAAVAIHDFSGTLTQYQFDVERQGTGAMAVGIKSEAAFDYAGNSMVIPAQVAKSGASATLEAGGATEANQLLGFFAEAQLETMPMMLLSGISPVWVDFNWLTPEAGTEAEPFNTLAEGLAAVTPAGTVMIKTGTSSETLRITQPVLLKAANGPVILGDNSPFITQYNQYEFGIPKNAPAEGVVAQIVNGEKITPKQVEIAKVETVVGGIKSEAPAEWFELVPMDSSYNLVWKGPAGVDLGNYEGIEVTLNKIEGQQSTLDRVMTFSVTEPLPEFVWLPLTFTAHRGVWRMRVNPYIIIARELQTPDLVLYAMRLDQAYPLVVMKLANSTIAPEETPSYTALSFQGNPINNWEGGHQDYLARDPGDILGHAAEVGGSAELFVTKTTLVNQSGVDYLNLVRATTASSVKSLQKEVVLKIPGLRRMKQQGLTDNAADVCIFHPGTFPGFTGAVRIYNAADPQNLQLVLSPGQQRGIIPISAVDDNDEVRLIVEGATKGHGLALDAQLRHKGFVDNQGQYNVVANDSISFSVYDMTITWEPVEQDNVIDTNPNAGGGKRIFPDRPSPDFIGFPRYLVNCRVALDPTPLGFPELPTVNFRLLDVDDPTPAAVDPNGVIDTNGAAGGDNLEDFGTSLGSLTTTVGFDGIAESQVTLGMQPGNNYRVAVDFDSYLFSNIHQLTVDDPASANFVGSNNDQKVGFNGALSPMLTVWRRLWCEFDTMSAIPLTGPEKNFEDGTIDSIQINVPQVGQTTVDVGKQLQDEANRFEGGRLEITGFGEFPVISNTDSGLFDDEVVVSGSVPLGAVGQTFKLYDDDVMTLPYHMSAGTVLETAFAEAYIKALPAPEAYRDATTPFKRNIEDSESAITEVTSVNQDLSNASDFWVAYMLTAYQGPITRDEDPAGLPMFTIASESANAGLLFVEVMDEGMNTSADLENLEKFSITRELGRMGGAEDADGFIMDRSTFYTKSTFAPVSIRRFRAEADF